MEVICGKATQIQQKGKISREDAVHYLYSMDTRKVLAVKRTLVTTTISAPLTLMTLSMKLKWYIGVIFGTKKLIQSAEKNARLSKELSEIRTVNEELQGQSKILSVELDRKSKRVRTIAKKGCNDSRCAMRGFLYAPTRLSCACPMQARYRCSSWNSSNNYF